MPYHIYELIDPRTNEVRYVGMTSNPQKRYAHHIGCFDGGADKLRWIKGLRQENLKPTMNIREIVDDKDTAYKREYYWIAFHMANSQPLVNVQFAEILKSLQEKQSVVHQDSGTYEDSGIFLEIDNLSIIDTDRLYAESDCGMYMEDF